MKIIKVKTKKDMQSFINLPKKLYHNIPYYIPPIWLDEKKAYNEKTILFFAIQITFFFYC